MSKLDYLTIVIVAICLAAVIFIMVRIYDLGETENPIVVPETVQVDQEIEVVDENNESFIPKESGRSFDPAQRPSASVPGTTPEPTEERVDETLTESTSTTMEGQTYLVLAGSFRLRSGAETEVNRLKGWGYSNAEVTLFNTGTYAAVLVDRFTDLEAAENLVQDLQNKYQIEAYVHEKRAGATEN